MNIQKSVLIILVAGIKISVPIFEENEHNFLHYHYHSDYWNCSEDKIKQKFNQLRDVKYLDFIIN